MTEHVGISADGTHILVRSSGPASLDEMLQTLAAIAQLRRTHGIDMILVDSRTRSGELSVADTFRGGELLAERLGLGARVAVLVSELTSRHSFFEDVATNRGATLEYFLEEDAARRWLFGYER